MKLLNSKAGVTVLEGVIALGLLAVVTAGAFGVLLSAARKSTQPDMREEMALAIEQAKDKLQVYINTNYDSNAKNHLPSGFESGLCGGDNDPLGSGAHQITCLLPKICDDSSANSQFFYNVTEKGVNLGKLGGYQEGNVDHSNVLQIQFTIRCNGYEL